MLQTIHGSAKQWIIVPLLVLLVLSFVAWGIADVFQGRVASDTVITVGKIEYTGQQVQAEVQRGMEYLRQMTGGAISNDQAMQFGFLDRTIDNLVERALLQQEAHRLGLVVSDQMIMSAIRDMAEFKRADGSFDADAFRSALMRVGASEQIFVNEQRNTLARGQVQQMAKAGIESPDYLNRALAAAAAEERTFDLFRVKLANQKTPPVPDDATLTAFMQENAEKFSAPEYRALSYVRLGADDVIKDMAVSDAEVAEYYETHKSEFETPEKRSFKQVLVDDQETAVKVIGAFNLTRDLDSAAKSVNAVVSPLSNVAQRDLPEELRDAAFSLTSGEVSKAIQSGLGWHVLQQVDQKPAFTTPLETAREGIRKNLLEAEAQEQLYQASARLDDLIASGASLEEIASQLKLDVKHIAAIDADGNDIAGIPADATFSQRETLAEAFRIDQGAQSDVISTTAGDYYVVRADNVTPSALRPLAAARAEVVKAWTRQEQETAAQETALKVIEDVKAGATLQAVADKYGVEASIERGITRDEAELPKYIPTPMLKDLFAIRLGDVTQFPGSDAVVIARLAKVDHPITLETAQVAPSFAEQANQSLQNELLDAYTRALQQRYTVTIDKAAIDRLFADREG